MNAEPKCRRVAPSLDGSRQLSSPLAGAAVPNRCLILSTETTGLDPPSITHRSGAVLFDVHQVGKVLSQVPFCLLVKQ